MAAVSGVEDCDRVIGAGATGGAGTTGGAGRGASAVDCGAVDCGADGPAGGVLPPTRSYFGVVAPKKIPKMTGTSAITASDSRENTFAAGGKSPVTRQANRYSSSPNAAMVRLNAVGDRSAIVRVPCQELDF